jgi:glycerol kinase
MSAPRGTGGVVVAIDAGTTGVRSRAVYADGRDPVASYREFPQYFPRPGWVEHDAEEIWQAVLATLHDVVGRLTEPIAAIGITNQRETVVAWSARTGAPLHRAIVWQDRRTAERCDELAPHLATVRARTGLVLDPYFSGTKAAWLLRDGGVPAGPDLRIGTIDAWLVWRLTAGASFVTDPSNASRTMLFDIREMRWSGELCDLLGVPITALPEVRASSGPMGRVADGLGLPAGVPIAGVAGDQQAALFGQACVAPGSAKNTYGTGSFVLMNVGTTCPAPAEGMLTTVAWRLGDAAPVYAFEGAVFVTGAAIQWLRDGLGIISSAAEVGPLAASVPDSGGVVVVPAFAGLGSPWWDAYARGAVYGITRGTTRAHLARAVVESIAWQVRDVVDAMVAASGVALRDLRVDGGAAVMDLLLEMQADSLGVDVLRPRELETTAMGAAYLAGLAVGVWGSPDDVADAWRLDRTFSPGGAGREGGSPAAGASGAFGADAHARWLEAVRRSRDWVR